MKSKQLTLGLVMAGSVALVSGCVERRVVYMSANPDPPTYAYSAPSAQALQLAQTTPELPPGGTVASAPMAPPAVQVEAIPVAPGPAYVWVPGCWNWNGRVWVWVGGRWAVRPWHGSVWVRGHWARHHHGYVWVGGRWG